MWAVFVRERSAWDSSVSEWSCLEEAKRIVEGDPTIIGVRLMPSSAQTWWWNKGGDYGGNDRTSDGED